MSLETFLAAALFVLVTSFTPGPNNAMLLASGVNFGFRRTLPHILGVTIGYAIMFTAVALGVGGMLAAEPIAYRALQIISTIYMLWLAWRIANAASVQDQAGPAAPLTFVEAALFQWVNPKGVAGALAVAANYLDPADIARGLPVMLALILSSSLSSAATWTLFGQGLRRWLGDERRRRNFNRVMAALLVASLWPMLANGITARPAAA